MTTVRLTAAQALTRYMTSQKVRAEDGVVTPFFAGVWAIFGHGNVAGIGQALHGVRDQLPTYRGHNEQTMAHIALAYAKAHHRRHAMAVTTSIGPGATNLVTAAATAHVNRLPVLLLPGDVFANRRPDPVLQQVEDFSDATVSANDCLRPVSRFWDRISRPEQLLTSLPRAMTVLTDPAECGPVTLAMCQDTQTEACDYPEEFFAERIWEFRRTHPDIQELASAAAALGSASKPLIVVGGGVKYSDAAEDLARFAERFEIPVSETQAGKGTLSWDHRCNVGAIGVNGSSAANALAAEADVVLGIGTRLQDFTSASRTLFSNPGRKLIQLNVGTFDGGKHHAMPLVADARTGLAELEGALGHYRAPQEWQDLFRGRMGTWNEEVDAAIAPSDSGLPTDAQAIGVVNGALDESGTVVCAAGGLPGELHKLWRSDGPDSYHLEYGYSCMGYEIAGGLGVKMARPEREVVVMVGDGSYMMANSDLSTAVMLGRKIIIVLLDNKGFGCIHRLQQGCGGEPFNNLFDDCEKDRMPEIDFVGHATSQGATAEKADSLDEFAAAMKRAKASHHCYVIVLDTDPAVGTAAGGAWWDVAVPEVSESKKVQEARMGYEAAASKQRLGD